MENDIMKMRKSLLAVLATAMFGAAGMVYAGPVVTITFKHVGASSAADAVYSPSNTTEAVTQSYASPAPATTVIAGKTNTYQVQNTLSASLNSATVRYKIGNKTCVFSTSYILSPGAFGSTPSWDKNAKASGGATCKATITSITASTGAWAVEFTMK